MSFLQKKNNARTTINMVGGLSSVATELTVSDGSVFPISGVFKLTIWDKTLYNRPGEDPNMEIVRATSISGNIVTIERGDEDTTGVAHDNGSEVAMLITAGTLDEDFENTLITRDITALVSAGAIEAQDLIPEGTSLTEFAELLLLTTFYPTYTNVSGSLAASGTSSNMESGSTQDVTLTVTFSRGSINGDIVGGVWVPSAFQDYRSGAVDYYLIDGTNTGSTNTKLLDDYQIVDGSNTWSSTTYYLIGPQPQDSKGANFETPLSAGSIVRTVTVTGRRNCFYGYSNDALTSANIRSLQSSVLNPANGTTFTISIPVGTTNVVFAYPSTLRDVNSVKYVEGLNAEIKEVFALTTVSVEGANGYTPINYKVYKYVPAEPFSATATYTVTI